MITKGFNIQTIICEKISRCNVLVLGALGTILHSD
ncbi:UNVERIFIED_ORG: hypothetical protein ABIC81_004633 [Bacillus proteolyticus]|nr:hypothetical protein IEW_05350 [Bacillus mycoides]EJQ58190.1 hypothetical protein IEY_05347 [Bacillus mycoides]EJV59797.1 hypothetical protein IEU_05478 [Bacillus mycoides]